MELLEDAKRGGPLDQAAEDVDGEDEELGGHWVSLPEATAVPDRGARLTVEQHLGARRAEDGQPVQKPVAETILAQYLEEEGQGDGVECASEVQLEEYPGGA